MSEPVNRCQLMLLGNPDSADFSAFELAAQTGLVTSCILYQANASEAEFNRFCGAIVPVMQSKGVAVLIADNTQVLGRCGADGIYLEKSRGELQSSMDQYSPHYIVGCGGFKDRHGALRIGEAKPDFVFFGKLGGDIRPEAHPKNLSLAGWWSEMIEIPGVVIAGTKLESVIDCAKTGADFVAVETCVFDQSTDPVAALEQADQYLELHAPRFEEVDS